jgi:hypothetical protein
VEPDVNANYNALVASFSRRFANGIQFQNNFRWAKSLDKNSAEGPGADTNPTYPQDLHQEYGPSDFDVKYTDTLSGLYELPFFRSQHGLIGKVLGGFRIDGTFTFRTGFPWTPKSGQSVQTPGGPSLSPVRPIEYLGGAFSGQSNDAFMRDGGNFPNGPSSYFVTQLPSGVTTLPPGIGRNVFRGPWYKSFDFGIAKSVKFPNRFLGEATQLDMRVNLFNAFNQLNLAPFNFYDSSTFVDNPQFFGRPTSALAGRVVELQARFSF